jgi:hypothetical protein
MQRHRLPGSLLSLAATVMPLVAQAPVAPRELGQVQFGRDLDVALRGKPDQPLFLLFQEVPG